MNDLEDKLKNILKKIKKPGISLQEANDLYFETRKLVEAEPNYSSENSRKLFGSILLWSYQANNKFCQDEWLSGKTKPTDQELNLMKRMMDEVLDVAPRLSDDEVEPGILAWYGGDFNLFVSSVEKSCNFIKGMVKVEIINRQKKITSQEVGKEKLEQKVDILTQLLTSLQNQIKELEEKLASSKDPKKLSSQIEETKKNYQQVQSQLAQNQAQINENKTVNKKDSQTFPKRESTQDKSQTQSNPDKFNWWWVVVPMGGGNSFTVGNSYFPILKKETKQINIYDEREE